ncbi:MAG: lamin tail domain-containing protein [Candidatus Sumerlaeia bacterium]|nr:lamin tail domain-containing protein [Candidatus Sumerlaeia bacterium]
MRESKKKRRWEALRIGVFLFAPLLCCPLLPAVVITEVHYHPQTQESLYEFVEIYNETVARQDLRGWRFTDGIDFAFTSGTVLQPKSYLVIARNPAALIARYGISNVVGPFSGALNNNSDHIILRDPSGGIQAEVDYSDDGKWPVAADGAGHTLSRINPRTDPMDPDSWAASLLPGGTPGLPNGFDPITQDTILIAPGEVWRYFKGITEASSPISAWRQIGFNDSGWLSGPTGIGYGDGDDATVLTDMQNNYLCIFCRKTFTLATPADVNQLILEVDHDDGFVAYLNGTEVGRGAMSTTGPVYYNTPAVNHAASVEGGAITVLDISGYKSLLQAGTNVLAVQVHNNQLNSSDLSFIPRLRSRQTLSPAAARCPVVLNEVRFNTSGTQYIELYNPSAVPANIGGYYLSNDPDNLRLYQIPAGTILPARGYLAFTGAQLGFVMNAAADRILFTSATADVVLDARAVEAGPRDWTEGRWPDGAGEWYYMQPTTGTANTAVLTTSVVINEIMYHPPSNDVRDEYIELYNTAATTASLAGWRFTRGISYDFPSTAAIGPGRYLVIAKDRARLMSRYSLPPNLVLGDYGGNLSDAGEKIRLRDANGNTADEVTYFESGHWSEYADGYGSSLELIDPRQNNANYQAWAPSDERSKAQWVFCSHSGSFSPPANLELQEIQFNLMEKGVVLLDDVRISRGSTDYLNSTFETGVGKWVIQGNHIQSHVTNEDARNGSRCLKLVATGRGDTGTNRVECDADTTMPAGSATYTISFWAKWQWGNRVLSTRILGNTGNDLPETYMLPIPALTGTPGAQNSVYQVNLGPVFASVRHSPVVPRPTDSVLITARASDADGVAGVLLYYKADADTRYTTTTMYDDGLHNDGAAGDGLYGGTIPARAANQTVAFYLQGTDGTGAVLTWPTDKTRPALYRVVNAPLSSTFPTYRVIMTSADENEMYNLRPKMSNEELNCTFIFDEKDVYYNCGVRFIGSPFHRAGGGYTGLRVAFNADELLHGTLNQARVDNNGGQSAIHDRISYNLQRWMGLPWCPQEWVYVVCNGRENRMLEHTLPPSGGYLDRYYRGDEDGYLFEMDDRFYFVDDDDWTFSTAGRRNVECVFDFPTTDKDFHRHFYEVRNHDNEDDYTSIVLMLDVFHPPGSQNPDEIAQVVNVEQWFKLFAVRACMSDWDFIAFERGKNCYLYWPSRRGKWDLLGWDSEITFQSNRTAMSIWSQAAPVLAFQQLPRHQHLYYGYIVEVLDKYFNRATLDPWIDHYAAVTGATSALADKTFITTRTAYLRSIIPTAPCEITTNGGNPFITPNPTVLLAGTAPVQVRLARISGLEYPLDWTGATTWRITLPLVPGANLFEFEFLDYDRRVVGTDSIIVTMGAALSGSISINNGATYSTSPAVLLYLTASGPLPITEMRFSNDNIVWSAWQPYATPASWTLSDGEWLKTVFFQFRDGVGNVSLTYSDSIILDTTRPTGSIVINNGLPFCTIPSVVLTLNCWDTGTGVTYMRLRNDGEPWQAWEYYTDRRSWRLRDIGGTRTVYVQYRDLAGNLSDEYSDTILLQPSAVARRWDIYR